MAINTGNNTQTEKYRDKKKISGRKRSEMDEKRKKG